MKIGIPIAPAVWEEAKELGSHFGIPLPPTV
jgi:hypothetical protein